MQKLYSKQLLGDLDKEQDPAGLLRHSFDVGLQALQWVGKPSWSTLRVTVGLDDDRPDETFILFRALTEEDI